MSGRVRLESSIQNAADAYINGATVTELAEQFEASVSQVSVALRKYGVAMRPRGRQHGYVSEDVRKKLPFIRELRADGMTYQEIGDMFGVRKQAVQQLDKAHPE